jgi:DNA processing protein
MNTNTGLASWIRLSLVTGLGPRNFRQLLTSFGLPENIFGANHSRLAAVVSPDLALRILNEENAPAVTAALEWADRPGQAIITLADESYPRQLLEISDPPPLLYTRGRRELLGFPGLAVVGSRNATPQGLANAENFSRAFSDAGFVIISGLALGIDAAAHRGGLEGSGSTIAVLGTGADQIYPPRNQSLGEEIVARGLMISEFPLSSPPLAAHFPRRNRLISGLARGCLVVEAAVGSGSLITARQAADQGREVFAIPGSIHSPVARGCHQLIKQGAKLVESAADVLEELGVPASRTESVATPNKSLPHEVLLQHMGYDPCDIDSLTARAGLTAEGVSAMLLQLELEGKIASLPGGQYQRLS